jgi:hypothetical protein
MGLRIHIRTVDRTDTLCATGKGGDYVSFAVAAQLLDLGNLCPECLSRYRQQTKEDPDKSSASREAGAS